MAVFHLLSPVNALSEFENNYARSILQENFDNTIIDPTILLDKFVLPEDMCQFLVECIRNGTTSIVSDNSFNLASPIGPVGTSAVILAPSTGCHKKILDKRMELGHWSRSILVNLP